MAGENKAFAAFVRTLPCLMQDATCAGRTEAHHAGRRAYSRRAHDETCIPLCTYHHMAWHSACGPFRYWRKMQRREWAEQMITETQERWNYSQESVQCRKV